MDNGVFRTHFRFEKNDAGQLERALLLPEVNCRAQRVSVPALEALCLTLRPLAYPNRLCDLERSFGRHYSVTSSVTNKVLAHIDDSFTHLLHDFNSHVWLDLTALEAFSQAVHSKIARLSNCWLFIDGTARAMCHPSKDRRPFSSVRKHFHALKYQAIMCPNGIICEIDGSFPGSHHDADFRKNPKLYKNNLERMYRVSTILPNCHTSPYGSQVLQYLEGDPPCLEGYLTTRTL
ncbi:hypothetical protein HPB48_018475 [Haemaphysalis longicornis]|uniref:DDE Tnp4 domain-containing protein n=1 Tax=Haemaphysalis longicornis TaxID=44386 RepID=A0A9J6GE27_HAELO|nr:hypothetical protein HPB48_018475 [Haemaphysalis longicornis]